MRTFLPENLIALSESFKAPLYVVGGSVRDFLCGFPVGKKSDWDICSPASEDAVLNAAREANFTVRNVYRNTGTVKLTDGEGIGYEFTRFRSDKYVRGVHTPSSIEFTSDMDIDARRRDFTCNAVYYDVKNGKFCDPLGGIDDILNGRLKTVAPAKKVFGEDGLRLLRLCRFASELGFSPDEDCLNEAKEHAALICDIVPERIFGELCAILRADEKHGVKDGAYRGLCLMRETGILTHVLPELALGDGMKQRADHHDYDVLEHSFRCVKYAPVSLRFAALLHDVGKPFCYLRDGNFYYHPKEGARIAREILLRLKAPTRLIEETEMLVSTHMRDLDCKMKEAKVRRALVGYGERLPLLLQLKQADFSACKDDLSPAPTVVKWNRILTQMREEGAPFRLSELNVKGNELISAGISPSCVGKILHELLRLCAVDAPLNQKEKLIARGRALFAELQNAAAKGEDA